MRVFTVATSEVCSQLSAFSGEGEGGEGVGGVVFCKLLGRAGLSSSSFAAPLFWFSSLRVR